MRTFRANEGYICRAEEEIEATGRSARTVSCKHCINRGTLDEEREKDQECRSIHRKRCVKQQYRKKWMHEHIVFVKQELHESQS